MSSSSNFSFHIKAISNDNESRPSPFRWRNSKGLDNAYGLLLPQAGRIGHPHTDGWPTEEQAHELVHTVISSIGDIQHLFDPRAFSDRLDTFYDHNESATAHDGVSTAEILMVLAIGKLIQGTMSEPEPFPGFSLFEEALNYLSNMCYVHAAGAQGVEVMGLMAFYLQCADRKEDAYIYVCTSTITD